MRLPSDEYLESVPGTIFRDSALDTTQGVGRRFQGLFHV